MPTLVDDRYELLEVLASGGMATVWRARDTRLNRLVALKRPHPAAADSKLPERMEREARAAAGVNHPNLVTMFDAGSDDGGPYLVMELLDGPTLALPSREIGTSEAIAIGAQIADALAAVHDAGIVHRDVKPSNVILSARGPCLTDFGIASIEESTRDLTQPGTIMATPSYAAPEVLAGDPPSPASDVFSLAALIYELLSEKPPYQGIDRTSAPPPLGDPAIDAVIRSGLARDPAERMSARDLAARLRSSVPTQAIAPAHNTLLMPAPGVAASMAGTGVSGPMVDANDTVVLPTAPRGEPEPPPISVPQPPPPATAVRPQPAREASSRLRLAAILVVVAVVAIAAMASGSPAKLAANTSTTTTIIVSSTSTIPPTTSAPVTAPVDPVVIARDRLAAILAEIGPPALRPKDRSEIMQRVDEAIDGANDGSDGAAAALQAAAGLIDERLNGDLEREALAALADVGDALGLDFSRNEEGDDD